MFHFDCFWMRELTLVRLRVGPAQLSRSRRACSRRIKAKGCKICVWINPYIAQRSPLFAEGAASGYLLQRPDGDVWQWDLWQPGMGFVDFTNPAARAWYAGKLRALLDMGVDCFKTDFGERIPTDVRLLRRLRPGADAQLLHAISTTRPSSSCSSEVKGEGEAVVFARSATVGGQKFPVHWGGDCSSHLSIDGRDAARRAVARAVRLRLLEPRHRRLRRPGDADLYKRWVAFGLLSSHSRLHGSDSCRVPWVFDDEAVDVLRFFTKLKTPSCPICSTRRVRRTSTAGPFCARWCSNFRTIPTCRYLDLQYMLGSALLVAPVFNERGQVEYYLPEGEWRNLLTGEVVRAGSGAKRRTIISACRCGFTSSVGIGGSVCAGIPLYRRPHPLPLSHGEGGGDKDESMAYSQLALAITTIRS